MKRILAISALFLAIGLPSHAQGNPKATATAHSVTISWTASTTKGVKYSVYRGKSVVGNTKATTYTDTTVAGGTTYSYSVFAVCASCTAPTHGKSVRSNTVVVKVP